MRKISKSKLVGGMALAAMLLGSLSASAGDVIKVGYMKIPPLVSYLYAARNGLFKAEGIETELVIVNNGPAAMSAVVSNSVDIGIVGTTAIALAVAHNQPVKIFGTTDVETDKSHRTWIVASKDAGVNSMADLVGKTVAIVGPSTQADLTLKDHLITAGVKPSDVKIVSIPFPQIQPALEVGNVDAAVLIDPFYSSVMRSKKFTATIIAEGTVSDLDTVKRYPLAAWFSRTDWLSKNSERAAGFLRAIEKANAALASDRSKLNAILESDFGMPPHVAEKAGIPLNREALKAIPTDYQIVIDSMVRTGLVKKGFAPESMIESVK